MEGTLIALYDVLVDKGVITEFSIEVLTLIALWWCYKLYFKPMKKTLEEIPSISDFEEIIKNANEEENKQHTVIIDSLNKIISFVDDIDDSEKANGKELMEIRRDIEQVRQHLNQLQNHLLYKGNISSSESFGNKELR